MLSCVALRWRLKTENAQWPFVSSPFLAGGCLVTELKRSVTVRYVPASPKTLGPVLGFWLVMSLLQARSAVSDMQGWPDSLVA